MGGFAPVSFRTPGFNPNRRRQDEDTNPYDSDDLSAGSPPPTPPYNPSETDTDTDTDPYNQPSNLNPEGDPESVTIASMERTRGLPELDAPRAKAYMDYVTETNRRIEQRKPSVARAVLGGIIGMVAPPEVAQLATYGHTATEMRNRNQVAANMAKLADLEEKQTKVRSDLQAQEYRNRHNLAMEENNRASTAWLNQQREANIENQRATQARLQDEQMEKDNERALQRATGSKFNTILPDAQAYRTQVGQPVGLDFQRTVAPEVPVSMDFESGYPTPRYSDVPDIPGAAIQVTAQKSTPVLKTLRPQVSQATLKTKTGTETVNVAPGMEVPKELQEQVGAEFGTAQQIAEAAKRANAVPKEQQENEAHWVAIAEKGARPGATQDEVAAGKQAEDKLKRFAKQKEADRPINNFQYLAGQVQGQGLDMMAEAALAGQPPPSKNPILTWKVYNRASQLAEERGLTAQSALMARNAAQANKLGLNKVVTQNAQLAPFIEMTEKNANILEAAMRDVKDLGAPVLNAPLRSLQLKFGGNEKVAALRAALLPVQADYARILQSPNATGVLTDEARGELQRAIGEDATLGMLHSALNIFRRDTQNRKEAWAAEIADLTGKTVVRGNQATPTAAPTTTAAAPPPPKQFTKDDVGKIYDFPGKGPRKITSVDPAKKQITSEPAQ